MKRINDFRAILESKRQIEPDIFLIEFLLPDFDGSADPGQFMMLKSVSTYDPFLRRPYSIFDCGKGRITILLKVVGFGSRIIAGMRKEQELNMLGPLGNGFPFPSGEHSILIAGGIGLAPLWFLAKELKSRKKPFSMIYGEKTVSGVSNEVEKTFGEIVHIATEDGSKGYKTTAIGIVPSIFDEMGERQYALYACGPKAMLKETISLAEERAVPVYVSLEERMACGIGVCLGCSVKSSNKGYLTVCKDGPVFKGQDVEF